MAHFAELDLNNTVLRVVCVDNFVLGDQQNNLVEQFAVDFLQNLYGSETIWKQTSFNTRAGVYYAAGTSGIHTDQSKAFRKNYAGVGWQYDPDRNAFVNEKPNVSLENQASLVFDEFSCLWINNTPRPTLEVSRV